MGVHSVATHKAWAKRYQSASAANYHDMDTYRTVLNLTRDMDVAKHCLDMIVHLQGLHRFNHNRAAYHLSQMRRLRYGY